MMKAREPRNVPDFPVRKVEVIGAEPSLIKQLAATRTSIIVLANAADCDDKFSA
jgi:hypothetical protein